MEEHSEQSEFNLSSQPKEVAVGRIKEILSRDCGLSEEEINLTFDSEQKLRDFYSEYKQLRSQAVEVAEALSPEADKEEKPELNFLERKEVEGVLRVKRYQAKAKRKVKKAVAHVNANPTLGVTPTDMEKVSDDLEALKREGVFNETT